MDEFLDNIPRNAAGNLSDNLEDSIVTKLSADPNPREQTLDRVRRAMAGKPGVRRLEIAGSTPPDTKLESHSPDDVEPCFDDQLTTIIETPTSIDPQTKEDLLAGLERKGARRLNLEPVAEIGSEGKPELPYSDPEDDDDEQEGW